ncbi:MAG: hypothetical protein WC661_17760 [Opitutaceae bacterium]|jgi:hypothetical protein
MKALPLILAASLLANAALVTTVAVRSSGKDGASAPGASGPAKRTPGSSANGANINGRDLVAALNSDDPEALRDILRAAGFSDDMVRSLVQMRIWKRYEARYKALQPQPDPSKPWWKDDARQNGWYGSMTKAQREEMRQIQKDQRAEMERVLGADKNNTGWGGWQDPRTSFLSADKRKELQQVQQDYQELMSEVQQEMQGFALPSDREKLRYLQEEQKRDIEALMTPEERTAYDLRMSQTAQNLRWQMTKFDATEEEYLKIFPLQKAFDEKYNVNDPYGANNNQRDQKFWQERQEAEKQLKAQMKDVIGADRYTDYLRSQDGDYQQLQAAARRLDLPATTATTVYSMREGVASSAQQIADNANLSADQKKQSLVALANSTRDQVRAALGAEGAEAYFKNNGMSWLKVLEQGNVVTFNKEGHGWSQRPASQPPPKKK